MERTLSFRVRLGCNYRVREAFGKEGRSYIFILQSFLSLSECLNFKVTSSISLMGQLGRCFGVQIATTGGLLEGGDG